MKKTSKMADKPFRRFFVDTFLKEYSWLKLRRSLRYAYRTSPYYHQLFQKAGVRPSDIHSIHDMNKVPFTIPEDLQENPRSFFSVPQDHFIKVFTTAGTTGNPKKAYFTQRDIEQIITSTATGLQLMYGVTSQDIVRLSFEVGYGTEIWGNRYILDRAYTEIGALTLATGRLSIKEELELFSEYQPSIFMDVSSRVNFLTYELKKHVDLPSLGVKKILTGAEPTPTIMRKGIEKIWQAPVYIGYGTTEIGLLMAGECEQQEGMHLSEINFLTEVVDPKTGESLEEGEVGELVFTTYDREGMPLVRYRSRDLGRILPGLCSCGLPFKRIEIKGRTDDMVPIGAGDNLFTRMFDEAVFGVPEVLEYQVVFDRKAGKDVVTIVAESDVINDQVKKKIVDAVMRLPEIKNGVMISKTIALPVVRLVRPNTIDRKSIKAKRLVDNRRLYD